MGSSMPRGRRMWYLKMRLRGRLSERADAAGGTATGFLAVREGDLADAARTERQYPTVARDCWRLDAQAVYCEGTADGQTVHWTFPLAGFVALPFTPGKNLEFPAQRGCTALCPSGSTPSCSG